MLTSPHVLATVIRLILLQFRFNTFTARSDDCSKVNTKQTLTSVRLRAVNEGHLRSCQLTAICNYCRTQILWIHLAPPRDPGKPPSSATSTCYCLPLLFTTLLSAKQHPLSGPFCLALHNNNNNNLHCKNRVVSGHGHQWWFSGTSSGFKQPL